MQAGWGSVFICVLLTGVSAGCGGGFKSSSNSAVQSSLGRPALQIVSPSIQYATKSTLTVTGRCLSGRQVTLTGDLVAPVNTDCIVNSFSAVAELSAPDGTKTIHVTQTDTSGQVITSSRQFVRDTRAPALQIVTPLANAAVHNSLVLRGQCEAGLPIQLSTSGDSIEVNCRADSTFEISYALTQTDGAIDFTLRQSDAANNATQMSLRVNKDTIGPALTIASPAAGASVGAMVTITGACESNLQVRVSGAGASAPLEGSCVNSAYSLSVVFTAGSGTKMITVSQTDMAGNSTQVTRSFEAAMVGPAVAFTSPAANAVFRNTLQVTGTCQTGLAVQFSGAGWVTPASTTCSSGLFSATISVTSGDGLKNIIATQTNTLGQSGSSSRSFLRDTTAPALTLSAPAASLLTKTQVQATGTCESGLAINVSGTGVAEPTNLACNNGMFSSLLTLSNGDGVKNIQFTQSDAAGNSTTLSRSVVRDATSPVVTIASPAEGSSATVGLTVSGACESGLKVDAAGSGVVLPVTVTCVGGAYSLEVLFTSGDGIKTILITQTDSAGNLGSATRNYTRLTPQAPLDGALLYAQNCASCHGTLENSTKRGKTLADINFAIGNIGTMSALSVLTQAERGAIATALGTTTVPSDMSFALKVPVDPQPFKIRYEKLIFMLGSSLSTSLSLLNTQRFVLGDSDYANLIFPKFGWQTSDIKAWAEGLVPVCASAEFKTKYPWSGGMGKFVQDSLGRGLTATEQALLTEIAAQTATDQEKFEIFCLGTLTSMEFVSK